MYLVKKNPIDIMPLDVVNWEDNIFVISNNMDITTKENANNLLDKWLGKTFIDPKEIQLQKEQLTLYIDDTNLIFEKVEENKIKIKIKKNHKESIHLISR